jgi:hypothetical protein
LPSMRSVLMNAKAPCAGSRRVTSRKRQRSSARYSYRGLCHRAMSPDAAHGMASNGVSLALSRAWAAPRTFRNLQSHGLDHIPRLSRFHPSLQQLIRFHRDRQDHRFRLLCLSDDHSADEPIQSEEGDGPQKNCDANRILPEVQVKCSGQRRGRRGQPGCRDCIRR